MKTLRQLPSTLKPTAGGNRAQIIRHTESAQAIIYQRLQGIIQPLSRQQSTKKDPSENTSRNQQDAPITSNGTREIELHFESTAFAFFKAKFQRQRFPPINFSSIFYYVGYVTCYQCSGGVGTTVFQYPDSSKKKNKGAQNEFSFRLDFSCSCRILWNQGYTASSNILLEQKFSRLYNVLIPPLPSPSSFLPLQRQCITYSRTVTAQVENLSFVIK